MIPFGEADAAGERVVSALLWGAMMAPLAGLILQRLLKLRLRGYLWGVAILFVLNAGVSMWWVTDSFHLLEHQRGGSILLKYPPPRDRQVEVQAQEILSARFAEIGRRPRPSSCYLVLQTASKRYESQEGSCADVMAAVQLLDRASNAGHGPSTSPEAAPLDAR